MVDFPQPDSPTRPRVSRSRSSSDTPQTAWASPTRRRSSRPLVIGIMLDQVGDADDRLAVRHDRGQHRGQRRSGRSRRLRRQLVPGGEQRLARGQLARRGGRPSGVLRRHCEQRRLFRAAQREIATGQRGTNGQPGGKRISDGGAPGIGRNRAELSTSSLGSEPSRPSVYGIRERKKIVVDRRRFRPACPRT